MASYTNPTILRYSRSRSANAPASLEILAAAMHDPIGTLAFTDTEQGGIRRPRVVHDGDVFTTDSETAAVLLSNDPGFSLADA